MEERGKPGVDLTFEPATRDREIPEEIAEYNQAIEEMCRETVVNFPDPGNLAGFYREVKKDGSRNRCWYRVTVTARIAADGQIKGQVSDVIDPDLLRADPHVRFRAGQLRRCCSGERGKRIANLIVEVRKGTLAFSFWIMVIQSLLDNSTLKETISLITGLLNFFLTLRLTSTTIRFN